MSERTMMQDRNYILTYSGLLPRRETMASVIADDFAGRTGKEGG